MGGFFAVASKENCVLDLFFGTDYHSHLGTRRAGMAVHGPEGFNRAIHNIQNSPFRTKFERDVEELDGNIGIGCISDFDPQPLLVHSHLGSFAITCVGKINNAEELMQNVFEKGFSHFLEMSNGNINQTEIVAALINQKESIVEGLKFVQGDDKRFHDCSGHDGQRSLLFQRPSGPYAGDPGQKRRSLLCFL